MVGRELRGLARLTFDGLTGLVDVVEGVHHNIASGPVVLAPPTHGRARGITGLVYRNVRRAIGVVGRAIDGSLARLTPLLGTRSALPGREALVAALNGVLGDHLARSRNPLAISMELCREGRPLVLTARGLAAIPSPTPKLLLLVHGLCRNDLHWNRRHHDHGAALARDLGYTPVYLRYNSGLHISVNGRAFADRLETLVRLWPVPLEELVLIGHSMGGLVCRSACHYGSRAGHAWRQRLDKLVFLGTPHHGAPLERGGNWVDVLLGITPYAAPLSRLGKVRSAGITDLRYGNLIDEDWERCDRFQRTGDRRKPMALPEAVECYTIAATTGKKAGSLRGRLVGDRIVPLPSALGLHADPSRALAFPASRRWIAYAASHLDLLSAPRVYARIEGWLRPRPSGRHVHVPGRSATAKVPVEAGPRVA